MAIFELEDFATERRASTGAMDGMRRALAALWDWYQRKRTARQLAHLDDRLRRDIGIEPDDACRREPSPWMEPHLRPDIR